MINGLVSRAKAAYDAGDYRQALEIYRNLSAKLGRDLFSYNIKKCEQFLSQSVSAFSDDACHVKSNSKLDPTTKYILVNEGKLPVDEEELLVLETELAKYASWESDDAPTKRVNPIPSDWPKDLKLRELPESTNDYFWWHQYRGCYGHEQQSYDGLSVIIPTFNRSNILRVTLACLANQNTSENFEVIVADDGSREDIGTVVREFEALLDIKLVRQPDYGYQLCAIRNLGIRAAKYGAVSILDCDMAPDLVWVDSFIKAIKANDDIAYIGPRKYVDTSKVDKQEILDNPQLISSLPEVITNNAVAGKTAGQVSVDWRLEHFKKTENLRLCNSPFRFFSGGNVAFSKKWIERVGSFDEEFTAWGGEDNEFGYRLYREGCFFKNLDGGMAYHQEPPGKENETDRVAGKLVTSEQVSQKVPYIYRKLTDFKEAKLYEKPLVSIYIPAYNAEDTIVRCVNSALNQSITDLEVCICDDGSTDGTLAVIEKHYADNPRVRYISQKNQGIGAASNSAVKLCQGYYIGQLDSDDYLNSDAVKLCLREFMKDQSLVCVYAANNNVDVEKGITVVGYNWPFFSREKITSAMICHHFRMFSYRAFSLVGGFDDAILNAVDYDIYLKLSELGPFSHINKIVYNRILHGNNTSILNNAQQNKNAALVVGNSLKRQKLNFICCLENENSSKLLLKNIDFKV